LTRKNLCDIPIAEIRVANPRTRDKKRFQAVVKSIAAVGLKKPITVAQRPAAEDGTRYDLICGQGRIEAFLALGQRTIPATVVQASREDQFLMSLVENIARRPPSNKDLLREVICLKDRGCRTKEIASKLGRDARYIAAINRLIERSDSALVEAVEANRIPLSIALLIVAGNEPDIKRAISQAHKGVELRGTRLQEAKRVMATQCATDRKSGEPTRGLGLSGRALVREYERRTKEQQTLVKRASRTREKLLLLKSAMNTLLADESFVTLLRAEELQEIPDVLAYDGAQLK
jgi:ParB family chromosome partitioning protein